jgi:hypothetical protein
MRHEWEFDPEPNIEPFPAWVKLLIWWCAAAFSLACWRLIYFVLVGS